MKLDHIFLQAMDIVAMKDFLIGIFGLEICDRPPFEFPGYWLGKNNSAMFHLASGGELNQHTGVIGHIAIAIDEEEALVAALEKENILYQVTWLPGRPVKQFFFHGPEGLTIEAVVYGCSK